MKLPAPRLVAPRGGTTGGHVDRFHESSKSTREALAYQNCHQRQQDHNGDSYSNRREKRSADKYQAYARQRPDATYRQSHNESAGRRNVIHGFSAPRQLS